MVKFTFDEKIGRKLEELVAELLPNIEIVNAYKDGMLTIRDAGGKVSSIHWLELLLFNVYKSMSDIHALATNDKPILVLQHKVCHMLLNANSVIHPIETAYIEWQKMKSMNALKTTISGQKTEKRLDGPKISAETDKIEA